MFCVVWCPTGAYVMWDGASRHSSRAGRAAVAECRPRGAVPRMTWRLSGLAGGNLPSLRTINKKYNCYSVFGRFPAELGPETRSNGLGLTNGAEHTQN